MYFVTTKRAGYALFCLTPSERFAVGVTDDQKRVHVLARVEAEWRVTHDWPVEERSHTEVMTRLGRVEEPSSLDELVRIALGA
ncbi:MAG TPA: hypothetical protein VFD84_18415 [Candidatus Binatia bacterium]|jgi:hypothetical protein|nr:hypothetical protein [Candidatus Binatia bacterium]